MENLANGETFSRSQVDDLPIRISPSDVGEAEMSTHICVAHVCVDQVKVWVVFIHSPGKIKCPHFLLTITLLLFLSH